MKNFDQIIKSLEDRARIKRVYYEFTPTGWKQIALYSSGKSCVTPLGWFSTIREAADAHNLDPASISSRLKSPKYKEFYYEKGIKDVTGTEDEDL